MKLGSIPSDLAQDVETDVLDPVVFSQNFCRFTLQNKGFLHSFSRLTFALKTSNASNMNATYPVNVGVHSLINRATLKIGAKTVCEIEDFNSYMAYKSLFIDNSINKERESVLTGRILYHQFDYDNAGGGDQNYEAKGYYIGNGTNKVEALKPAGAEFLPTVSTSASFVATGIQPNDNILVKNTPVLQVALSDLFPFLRFNQLPLFMMKEQVSIELVFSPLASNNRFCVQNTAPDLTEQIEIDQNSVSMVADYIFYDGQMLADYEAANRDMNFQYVDYRLAKRSYTSGSSASQTKQILNVGGAGRIVNKLLIGMYDDTRDAQTLCNIYSATSASLNGSNNGQLTTNVRYNDHYLYPIDRSLSAIQFHDIVQTEQNVPYITRDEYNMEGGGTDGGGLAVANYNGHAVSNGANGLRGNFFFQAHRLNRNERINSRGIELETLYSSLRPPKSGTVFTQRCWLELVRTATLKDGFFDCYFA